MRSLKAVAAFVVTGVCISNVANGATVLGFDAVTTPFTMEVAYSYTESQYTLRVDAGSVQLGPNMYAPSPLLTTLGSATWSVFPVLDVGQPTTIDYLSFDAAHTGGLAQSLTVRGYDATDTQLWSVDVTVPEPAGAGQLSHLDVVITQPAARLEFVSGTDMVVDNIQVTVPEPGTLAVIMAGGLSLLHRPRRRR